MKVLITGGTGFLGSYTLRELVKNGHAVRAIRRHPKPSFRISPDNLPGIEWVEGDILDVSSLEEALEGMDAVIHAAAKVSYQSRDKAELYRTNTTGTANVVNAALSQAVSRFIHISSVAALGKTEEGGLVTEGKQWEKHRLTTHYAISKYQAEMEVWRGMGEGLNVAILNPSTILGYGDWNNGSCAIFRNIYHEFPWYTEGVNGFVDVHDVARAVVCLLDSEIEGERFILNGENWDFRHLFNQIAEGFGKRPPFRKATPLLASLAWRMERIQSLFTRKTPVLTRESAEIAMQSTRYDNGKFLHQFPGFRFTPLEQTLAEACRCYLENRPA